MNQKEIIIDLFRKTISSLCCIEKTSKNKELVQESTQYISDLIPQYKKYLENSNSILDFKYNENDIIDFSYRCIEDKENDLVRFAEDVQFGIIELTKELSNNKD